MKFFYFFNLFVEVIGHEIVLGIVVDEFSQSAEVLPELLFLLLVIVAESGLLDLVLLNLLVKGYLSRLTVLQQFVIAVFKIGIQLCFLL